VASRRLQLRHRLGHSSSAWWYARQCRHRDALAVGGWWDAVRSDRTGFAPSQMAFEHPSPIPRGPWAHLLAHLAAPQPGAVNLVECHGCKSTQPRPGQPALARAGGKRRHCPHLIVAAAFPPRNTMSWPVRVAVGGNDAHGPAELSAKNDGGGQPLPWLLNRCEHAAIGAVS